MRHVIQRIGHSKSTHNGARIDEMHAKLTQNSSPLFMSGADCTKRNEIKST